MKIELELDEPIYNGLQKIADGAGLSVEQWAERLLSVIITWSAVYAVDPAMRETVSKSMTPEYKQMTESIMKRLGLE